MSDGRPGDGGGDCSKPRRGLNRGERVDVDEPTDAIEDTERFGDLIKGLMSRGKRSNYRALRRS